MPLADPNRPLLRALGRAVKNSKGYVYRIFRKELRGDRSELVVLGTGWASLNLIRQIDPSKYKVTIVSPRPHFLFTPLLTCALSGTLTPRSITEPIRPFLNWGGRPAMSYVKAAATDIDVEKNLVHCIDDNGDKLEIPYNKLAIGVGSLTNTFGIPGVLENSTFIKEASDVQIIRDKIFANYNLVSNSPRDPGEVQKLLNVVVVGGGPAGLEAAAEINDLMNGELKTYFARSGTVTLIEMLPNVLPMFGKKIADFTTQNIRDQGVKTLTEHRVERVDGDNVYAVNVKTNEKVTIPYGQLVWASGVGPTQLTKKLIDKVQPQSRFLKVRPDLSVIGAPNIYGMGDCVYVEPPKLAEKADEFDRARRDLSPVDWLLRKRNQLMLKNFVQLNPKYWRPNSLLEGNRKSLKQMLTEADAAYKPPIPTAQMARQAGGYLGFSLNRMASKPRIFKPWPYAPNDSGAMSYIGKNQAVVSLNIGKNMPRPLNLIRLGGWGSNALWHGYYFINQTSLYNQIVSATDLIRARFSNRDLTEAAM